MRPFLLRRVPLPLLGLGLVALLVIAAPATVRGQGLTPLAPPVLLQDEEYVATHEIVFGELGQSLAVYSREIDFPSVIRGQVRSLGEDALPVGPPHRFGFEGSRIIRNADAAPLADGGFVVVYAPFRNFAGTSSYLTRFDEDGTPLAEDVPIGPATDTAEDERNPRVIPLPDGGWRVFWISKESFNSDELGYYTQRYAADGTPVSSPQLLGQEPFDAVDVNEAGQGWAALTRPSQQRFLDVQRLNADGLPTGTPIEVGALADRETAIDFRIAVAPDGGFLAAWTQNHLDVSRVHVRAYRADGTPRGAAVVLAPPEEPISYYPSIDALPDGSYALALLAGERLFEPSRLFLYHLAANGAAVARRQVEDEAIEVRLATRSDGRIRVLWEGVLRGPEVRSSTLYAQDFSTVCSAVPGGICLQDGRFRVEVAWKTMDGKQGIGTPRPLTPESAAFWFFREENLELFVKVLDACDGYDRYWVFLAGLTNVAVDVTVTDTATGEARTYSNPQKSPFQPIYDTQAFQTCANP